jgi:TPR repeat protein
VALAEVEAMLGPPQVKFDPTTGCRYSAKGSRADSIVVITHFDDSPFNPTRLQPMLLEYTVNPNVDCHSIPNLAQYAQWCQISEHGPTGAPPAVRVDLTLFRDDRAAVEVALSGLPQPLSSYQSAAVAVARKFFGPYTGPTYDPTTTITAEPPTQQGDTRAALALWQPAHAGDARAEYQLGMLYTVPVKGAPKDYASAAYWLSRAAQQGDAHAYYQLGLLYDGGSGVPHDPVKQILCFRQAAALGYTQAMTALSESIEVDPALKPAYASSRLWLEKAVAADDPLAMEDLGLKEKRNFMAKEISATAPKDWFLRAGNLGLCQAFNSLGGLYLEGISVPQDVAQASVWFHRAAACPTATAAVKATAAQFLKAIAEKHIPPPYQHQRMTLAETDALYAALERGDPNFHVYHPRLFQGVNTRDLFAIFLVGSVATGVAMSFIFPAHYEYVPPTMGEGSAECTRARIEDPRGLGEGDPLQCNIF